MKPGAIFWLRDEDGYAQVGVADRVDSDYTQGITNHYSPDGRWISTSECTFATKELSWEPSPLLAEPICRNCSRAESAHAHDGGWCPSETPDRIWSNQFRFEAAEAVHA